MYWAVRASSKCTSYSFGKHITLHLPAEFRQNRTISERVMTSRWRPRHRNSTSGFGFRDFGHPRISKSTCIPNFGDIPQSTAEILLLPVFKKSNVRHVGILLPVPIFTFASPSACHSASTYQISSKSDHPRQLWRYIYLPDGGHGTAILLPLLVFVITLIWEGGNLPAYQISARYLNPRLWYYYFRYLRTNVRHVGTLLPIPIFLRLRHHPHVILHLSTRFRPNRTIRNRLMTSYPFFKITPWHRNSTSGFSFRVFAPLGRSKSTCIPNFDEIFQSTAEI